MVGKVSTTIQVVDKASKRLNNIYKAINRVNTAFNKLGSRTGLDRVTAQANKVNRTLQGTATSTQKIKTGFDQGAAAADNMAKSVDKINKSAKKTDSLIGYIGSKLKWLASVYLGVMGGRAIVSGADALTSNEIRFQNIGTNPETTQNKIFNAAQASLTDYLEMTSNVGKTLTLASQAFGDTMEAQVDNAIKFQEIMAKSYALSGASAAEMSSSMYQLVQALNSGNLQGDELRSVREGAPMAAKAIEKYAQAVYNTTDSLKEMGSQGLITSRMVVEAILAMDEETEAAFANVRKNMTFAQMWTQFKNDAIRAFQPFLETLAEIGNSPAMQGIFDALTSAVYALGRTLNWVATVAGNTANFIHKHWSVIGPIFYGVASAVTALAVVAIGKSLVAACRTAIVGLAQLMVGVTSTQVAMLSLAGIIGVTIWYFSAMGMSADSLSSYLLSMAAILGVIAIVSAVTGAAIFGMTWPVYAVLAGVLALLAVFMAFPEVVGTAVGTVAAILGNFLIGAYNGFVDFANFLHNVFIDPVGAVIALFGDMAINVLNIIKSMLSGVETLINLIPGVEIDITSGISNVIGTVEDKIETFKDKRGWEEFVQKQDYFDVSSIAASGATTAVDWRDSLVGGLQNIGSTISGLFDSSPPGDYAIITPFGDEIANALGDIGDDTSKISKSVELTDEDLKYLRDVAEREAINKWTAAQIHIDMTNNNNVQKINDLDGIAVGLRGILLDELGSMTNGWHNA